MNAFAAHRPTKNLWRDVNDQLYLSLAKAFGHCIRWLYRGTTAITFGNIPPVVGAACIVQRDGRILFIDRSDGLGYSLPGGIMKTDETLERAVLREVREETGFEVEILALLGAYSGPDRDPRFSSVSIVYTATIVGGNEKSSREGKVQWLELDRLPAHMAFDGLAVIRDYLDEMSVSVPRVNQGHKQQLQA